MKLGESVNFVIAILIATVLVATSAAAQEAASKEFVSTDPMDDYSLGSANALLKPPDTASPRATLQSVIENMNLAYGMLMKAHRTNLKTPGYFPSESVRQMAKQAEEYFESSVECLNLSQVPKNLKEDNRKINKSDIFMPENREFHKELVGGGAGEFAANAMFNADRAGAKEERCLPFSWGFARVVVCKPGLGRRP